MLTDATVPQDEIVSTDVWVVGAGPAGIALAGELSAAGLEGVVLERGGTATAEAADPDAVVNIGLPCNLAGSRAWGVGGSNHWWRAETPAGGGFGRLRELEGQDSNHTITSPTVVGLSGSATLLSITTGHAPCSMASLAPQAQNLAWTVPGLDRMLPSSPLCDNGLLDARRFMSTTLLYFLHATGEHLTVQSAH